MSDKKYPAILMIAILVAISVLPSTRSSASEVMATRVNSEANKTRIVIQFDEPTQYQTRYTSEPSISIYLLKTVLGPISEIASIRDELVETVTFKEIMGNMVDVDISLKKHVNFRIFPLESPDRIVIDVMPKPTAVEGNSFREAIVGAKWDKEIRGQGDKETGGADTRTIASSLSLRPPPRPRSVLPLRTTDYMLAQLCLDALLIVALTIMGIKLWSVARVSKRSSKALKKKQIFADMISGRQQSTGKKNNSGAGEPPVEPHTAGKGQKRRKKHVLERSEGKGRGVQPTSIQKEYKKVYELAQLGVDRLAISQQSNVPIGEVNLILDLSKAKSRGELSGC